MDYMTTKEAANRWGITIRQVQSQCEGGRVDGAVRLGHMWLIRKDAPKPMDGRTKAAREIKRCGGEAP
ncbi:MAG: helix-turn-helix domain-containing protein [Peptococcaceae bacterium]|nr:helix-turn-helix domain-containing protein [Peptococcaceae bacterium]